MPAGSRTGRVTGGLLRRVLAPGAQGQAVRYVIAGATVAAVYVGATLLLSGPAGAPIQAAIPVAYVTAVSLHFVLQRFFVFADAKAFALAVHHQIGRYVAIGAVQYAITAASTALLPPALGLSERVVYVGAVAAISAMTFIFLRTRVFHPPRP